MYLFFFLLWASGFLGGVLAQPAPLQFQDCFTGSSTDQKLNITNIYAQFFPDTDGQAYLNLTLLGTTPQTIVEASNGSDAVASESGRRRRVGGS